MTKDTKNADKRARRKIDIEMKKNISNFARRGTVKGRNNFMEVKSYEIDE